MLLHCREAHAETLDIWRAEDVGAVGGIMHCFSGDLEVARRCLDLGLLISIAGPVTYPNARRLAEVVRALPLDRLVVETDCPYLPPQPWRGQRNEPAYLPATAARVAELLGQPVATVAAATTANAARLLGLPGLSAGEAPAAGMNRPRAGLWRRELRRVLGGALNVTTARIMNRRRGTRLPPPALELAPYLSLPAPTALDTVRLLAGRSNRERGQLTEAILHAGGLPVERRPYRTVEGAGVNLFVDLGPGGPVLPRSFSPATTTPSRAAPAPTTTRRPWESCARSAPASSPIRRAGCGCGSDSSGARSAPCWARASTCGGPISGTSSAS